MFDMAASRKIKLLGLDVDGVLTDNAIFVGAVADARVEFKRFDIQDGLGIAMLRGSGIEVALISGRHSEATSYRAAELKIADVLQVAPDGKVPAIQALLDRKGLTWEQLAFVGDDLADLPVFERAGLPIAVANARDHIKGLAKHVTIASGGHGAVREVIERLLQSRGEYEAAVDRYLGRTERSE